MARSRFRYRAALPLLVVLAAAPAFAEGEGFYGPLRVLDSEEGLMKTVAETEDLFVRRGYRYDDSELDRVVDRIGRSMAPKPTDGYIRYRFAVLRDIVPNAFSLPDGQVYLNMSLLALLENEAQLASVLAHEVQHTAGHHGILSFRSARRKIITSMALGPLTLGVGDYFLIRSIYGYSRDLEEEADLRGAKKMIEAGYDPRQVMRTFEILDGDGEGETLETRASKWSTHPELQARIEYTRQALPGLTVGVKPGTLKVGAQGWSRLTRRARLDTAGDLILADYPRSAMGLARRLIRDNGSDPQAHFLLAEARRTLGARPALEGEQELTRKDKRRALGNRYYRTREEWQASLLQTDEGRANQKENMEAAIVSYRRTLALDAGMAEAHRGLGFAYAGLDRHREAGQQFVVYLRARPNAPDKPLIVEQLKESTARIKNGGSSR